MALIKAKGTTLNLGIAGASAAVGQMISIDLPEMEVETFEADTLDTSGAGIPYKASGRIEGGSVGGELFLDPMVSSTAIKSFLISGAANLSPAAASNTATIVLGDGSTTFTFATAGMSLGGTVALGEACKGKFSAKLDGIGVWS